MPKLIGNLRITANTGADGAPPHFDVAFMPHAGHLDTKTVRVATYDDLVAFLMEIRISEDEATRWAGRARSGGVTLIPNLERNDSLLRESGLLT